MKKQQIIDNFIVKYYGKSFEAKGNLFFQYFSGNDQISADGQTNLININGKETHDPVFYPLEPLGVELAKILK